LEEIKGKKKEKRSEASLFSPTLRSLAPPQSDGERRNARRRKRGELELGKRKRRERDAGLLSRLRVEGRRGGKRKKKEEEQR